METTPPKLAPTSELVSIIIPVRDNPRGLEKMLASIGRLEDDHFEVIVVDDGSSEELSIPPHFGHTRLIRLPVNRGAGMARNVGVKESQGKILAFSDSDCMVPHDWLKKIRKVLQDPIIQVVAGSFGDEKQPNAISWVRYLESTFYHLSSSKFVNCFTSANFAIRRKVFERIGGFPPMRVGEDLILGYKLSKIGIEILWYPSLTVKQHFRPTLREYFRQQRQWSGMVFLISLFYPEVHFLKWPVRRRILNIQMILFMLTLVACPLLLFFKSAMASVILLISFFVCLVALNRCFLSYAMKKTSAVNVAKVFLLSLSLRNTSWASAVFSVILRYPRFFINGIGRLALFSLNKTTTPSGYLKLDKISEIGREKILTQQGLT